MKNLKRYDFDEYDRLYGAKFVEDDNGEWVKFSDIEEILKTPTNTGIDATCSLCEAKRGCGVNFMMQYNFNFCPNCGRKLTSIS